MQSTEATQRLVKLDRDHPGFRDLDYRQRRDFIAKLALDYKSGDVVPTAPYTKNEELVWQSVLAELAPLHQSFAAKEYLDAQTKLELPTDSILQIATLNKRLNDSSDFQFQPVAGLIEPWVFLESLAKMVFLSTQYIRHESKPFYTPEPDVIHEMVGHGPSFYIPEICQLSQVFGETAQRAKDKVQQVINAYWFTLEFGMVYENGQCKAIGAGLLSSVDELKRSQEINPLPFDLEKISRTEFDPSAIQPFYFAAESFGHLIKATTSWLNTL